MNLQNWSEPLVFLTFWLGNVLRATTACAFSTSQLPKVVRSWCVLYILTSKCALRHNGVQFFISHLATRRFSEPTFRRSGATNHWEKHSVSRLSQCIFFLLTLSLLWSSLFYSSLLSDSSHLCFSSVHIVGSLTSKLPSIIIDFLVRIETIRNRNAYRSMFMGNCLVPYLTMVTLAGSGAMVFPGSNTSFCKLATDLFWQSVALIKRFRYILVGGWPTPLKNMKVNGKDDIPYMMENKTHVWNHQPVVHMTLQPTVISSADRATWATWFRVSRCLACFV